MDLLADLTPAQRQAVTHVDGPLLVLAGAGSGKTRVITRRIAYLRKQGIPGENILALTFTNKAAGEMKDRLLKLEPGSKVWVGTFHSLCARLLRTYAPHVGLDRGFTIYDQADRLRTVKDAIERLGHQESGVSPEKIEAAISRAKNELVTPKILKKRAGDHVQTITADVYEIYQERLKATSSVDFDDLLTHVVTLVKENPKVRADLDARFKYVLVDEYQDTNLAQYAIVRGLSVDHPNLCVTGDPDQSIYGWRGANLNNILEFEHDYPGTKVVRLERNYRSTKNILAAADALIVHNKKRKPKKLTTENPAGQPVELIWYENETEEAQGVVRKIVSLVREGEYSYKDVAVFCRITALTRVFEQACRAAGIPYQVVGGQAFYERQEIKDVLAYLNLIANPKDDISFLRVINTPARAIGKTTLDKLKQKADQQGLPLLAMARQATSVPGLKEAALRGFRDFGMLMDELNALRDHAAPEVIQKLLSLSGYRKALEAEDGKEQSRLENLDELISAAREFDDQNPGGTILDFLENVTLASAVDRWDADAGAVTLMTLHAAKGLEFPVVFLIGVEQNILPHSRAVNAESNDEMEEERRLMFVGITRAEKELYISYSRIREFRGSRMLTIPSPFLRELPTDTMSCRNFTSQPEASVAPRRVEARPTAASGFSNMITARDLQRGVIPNLKPASTLSPGDPLSAFVAGMMVSHPDYGLGRLIAVDGAGPNRKGRVAFAVGGERTFILARSPLKPVKGR